MPCRNRISLILALLLAAVSNCGLKTYADTFPADTIRFSCDSILSVNCQIYPARDSITVDLPESIDPVSGTYLESDWRYHLRKRKIDVNDESIRWPGFVDFCLDVYRWVDRTFNSTDSAYVKGTGYYGMVTLISDNWTDAYSFSTQDGPHIYMMSAPYANLGINVKYSILSIGYSVDMNAVFGNNPTLHKKWDFGVGMATFNIEAHWWRNEGGTYIRKFGDYHPDKRLIRTYFQGLTLDALNIHGFYLFNSRKFSLGAALSNSGNQRKSAGSAILGFDFSSCKVNLDFSLLPDDLKAFYTYPIDKFTIRYRSYSLISGYSYNWVINRHLTFNITAFPGVGITDTLHDSTQPQDRLWNLNFKLKGGLIYNNKRFFASARANLTGNFYLTDQMSFINVIQNYQFTLGVRF